MTTWEAALTDFENKIAQAELALREGTPFDEEVLQPFEAPKDLGPFPVELANWAEMIVERSTRLAKDMGYAMAQLETEMATTRKESAAARSYAPHATTTISKFFDRGA